jgi:predicted O-linked N-acetylglucosamine transferase (SPINDLY family)
LDNLGVIYEERGRPVDAVSCYRRSLKINDRNPIAYNNLANSLRNPGLLQEAAENCQKALELDHNFPCAHNNFGTIYSAMGLMPEAVFSCRKSLDLKPDPAVHSNLLMTLHYLPGVTQEEIHAEAVRWDKLYARGQDQNPPAFGNSREENRTLRIGYVSPDFRSHSVAYFIEPVIESHDRESCEVYCYASVDKLDAVTRRIENLADHWRDIAGKSGLQLR